MFQVPPSLSTRSGCQKAIAAKIIAGDGNFVLGVKGNQPTLHDRLESFLDEYWKDGDWSGDRCHRFQTIVQLGACQMERYYYAAPIPKREAVFAAWPSVQVIGMVINVRRRGDEVTEEVRY